MSSLVEEAPPPYTAVDVTDPPPRYEDIYGTTTVDMEVVTEADNVTCMGYTVSALKEWGFTIVVVFILVLLLIIVGVTFNSITRTP